MRAVICHPSQVRALSLRRLVSYSGSAHYVQRSILIKTLSVILLGMCSLNLRINSVMGHWGSSFVTRASFPLAKRNRQVLIPLWLVYISFHKTSLDPKTLEFFSGISQARYARIPISCPFGGESGSVHFICTAQVIMHHALLIPILNVWLMTVKSVVRASR